MKKLTKLAVLSVFDCLLTTMGHATTLEIKLLLRDFGYEANQKEVSELVSEIATERNDLEISVDNDHKVYSLETEDAQDGEDSTDDSGDISDVDAEDYDVLVFKGNNVKAIYSNDGDSAWVVHHKNMDDVNEVHVYKGAFTRDQVRNSFRKMTNTKIQDSRAKRFKNWNAK